MMADIWFDPPGILYAISYIIAIIGFVFIRKKDILKRKNMWLCIFLTLFLSLFMALTGGVSKLIFWPCIFFEWYILYELMYVCNRMSWLNTLYYTIHIYIIGEFSASLAWLLYYFMLNESSGSLSFLSMVNLVIIYILIQIILFFIAKKVYRSGIDISINGREVLTVLIIGLSIFLMSNLSYASLETPFSAQIPREHYNIHTWVDLGGLAILFAYHIQLIELQLRVEFDNIQNILDMQYANYQISKKSVDMVNQKYHDLKHQINLLRAEFNSKEAMEYLDKMEHEIESYEAQNKTGNKILDTILTGKSLYCQQNDIKLTVVADGSLINFMDIMDISALFGNALDNAIESVNAIPDKEQRLIHLTISQDRGFVRIRLENCYLGELDYANGLPQTTKRDRNYHGYGIKSMKSTVQKYNGSVRIDAKNGWFELRILIPMNWDY